MPDTTSIQSSAEQNVSQNISPGQSGITNIDEPALENATTSGIASGNSILNKGVVFPIIRLNDHYLLPEEIVEFYIESGFYKDYHDYFVHGHMVSGFVPTCKLIVNTTSPDLIKQNQVKVGDKLAIFFHGGGAMVKSYRGDYIIKTCFTSDKPTEIQDKSVTYVITGELYVPNLNNESIKFNFNGSSRDAMYDASQQLGLSFFFCDPEDTDDYQGWICDKNLRDYCADVAAHAWKEFNAFYDAWIDPRYGLSFINVNKMLIEDGLDEPLDITPFVNAINNSLGVDGRKISTPDDEARAKTRPQAKMITNIPRDDESATPFYILNWNLSNQASEISMEIGVNQQEMFNIENPGLETQNTTVSMSYSIPMNQTKLANGFFCLTGPGVNVTYTQADQVDPTQSFVQNMIKRNGGTISSLMSNEDAEQLRLTGGNRYNSGNVNRFYYVGFEHNVINNLQLQKQILEVELQGCNLAIMRGEKLPVLIMDYDRVSAIARAGNFPVSIAENVLYETACGWYIIDGIKWEWAKNNSLEGSTYWRTKLKLVRREWPIPGRNAAVLESSEPAQQTIFDINKSNSGNSTPNTVNKNTNTVSYSDDNPNISEGYNSSNKSNNNSGIDAFGKSVIGTKADDKIQAAQEDTVKNSDVPLTGLTEGAKDVYYALQTVCPNIKLVSARRWAVDEDGNRVEGNAFVMKDGLYKCVNANGDIMYFKSNNSRHLYGQAFDIINSSGVSFDDLLTKYILVDDYLLQTMAANGFACVVESTKDDAGVTSKHYHFGTEKEYQELFWNSVKAINVSMSSVLRNYINNIYSYNDKALAAAQEIARSSTNE